MSCIKTGALVYFDNYSMTARADIYEIDSCYIVRWNTNSIEYVRDSSPASHTVMYWAGETVWHRNDLGITVLPKAYLHTHQDYNNEQG